MRSRFTLPSALLLCLGLCATPLPAKKKSKPAPDAAEQKRAVHALNRLTFGARPGDVQQVAAMGVDRWIDLQLHPEKISDRNMDSRLSPLRTLHMSSKELMEDFPDTMMLKQVMDGKRPLPSDPARRAVYQVQIARLRQKQDAKDRKEASAQSTSTGNQNSPEQLSAAANAEAQSTGNDAMNAMNGAGGEPASADMKKEAAMASTPEPKPTDDPQARRREQRLYADLEIQGLIGLPPDERYKKVLAMPVAQQVALGDSLRGGNGGNGMDFLDGLTPSQKETLLALNNPQAVVVVELSQAKLLRAIYSERQLEEVMTDFWFNHFNVFVGKGPERLLLTGYEQQVIRPHALGKFEDLLVATAESPAMLFYLDNWMSVGPNSFQAVGAPQGQRPMRRGPFSRGPYGAGPYGRPRSSRADQQARRKSSSGLNENYGRELLELHTLSVNGGYSQRDVTEVAKVFTGWTLDKPLDGMNFHYDPRMHEPGPKFVLGHRIKPKGEDEGKQVLHMLATSPQTAHFISLKLAERFVSDDPSPALVDRMAKTFQKKKGNIREVLTTLFHSPEFWADTTYRAKVKTPLEFVASAVRATDASVDDAMPLARQLNNMGMPLYGAQPPTGYSMKADTWVGSSALLNRMNFALALTSGKVHGVKVDATQMAGNQPEPDAGATIAALEASLLAADVSKQTHDSIVTQIVAQLDSKPSAGKKPKVPLGPDANAIAGLLLGSPEFQRR